MRIVNTPDPVNSATNNGRTVRLGARVLLFNAKAQILLMEDSDPRDPERGTWWITPGGGIEAGETAAQAARREVREETGLEVTAVAGPVASNEFELDFHGVPTLQRDQYFTAQAPARQSADIALSAAEQASLKGSKWWSLAELQASESDIRPSNLAEMISNLPPV